MRPSSSKVIIWLVKQPKFSKRDTLANGLFADIYSITHTFQEMSKTYLTSSAYAEKEDRERENAHSNVEKLRELLLEIQGKILKLEAL